MAYVKYINSLYLQAFLQRMKTKHFCKRAKYRLVGIIVVGTWLLN